TNGDAPDLGQEFYTGPFQISPPAVLRLIAYDAAFVNEALADPVSLIFIPSYSLIDSTPGGGGVTFDPPGGIYVSNSVVTIVATNAPGWTFLGWTGEVSGTN